MMPAMKKATPSGQRVQDSAARTMECLRSRAAASNAELAPSKVRSCSRGAVGHSDSDRSTPASVWVSLERSTGQRTIGRPSPHSGRSSRDRPQPCRSSSGTPSTHPRAITLGSKLSGDASIRDSRFVMIVLALRHCGQLSLASFSARRRNCGSFFRRMMSATVRPSASGMSPRAP
jgi:hypothetical protein